MNSNRQKIILQLKILLYFVTQITLKYVKINGDKIVFIKRRIVIKEKF